MQAEGRGGGDIDVGRRGVVERHTEHLADLARGDGRALRRIQPPCALRRNARAAQVDDAADGALEIDDGLAALVGRA